MNSDQIARKNLLQRYPKGTLVTARVRALTPFGALLTLADGTPGIVRSRELSWEQDIEDPKQLLSERQTVRVLVLDVDDHHQPPRLELSLRQAERDPWKPFSQPYYVGQILRRKVTGLIRIGAFVELEPAINGFLPLHEISPNPPEEIEQALWIGDTVDAVITRVDYPERQIGLSLRQRLIQLERQREQALQREYVVTSNRALSVPMRDLISSEDRIALLRFFAEQHLPQPARDSEETAPSLAQRLPRILIADNDASFRLALQRVLTRAGHQVESCDNAERAIELCGEKEFELVLLDYEFQHGKLDGIKTTERLTKEHPDLPIILITGVSWLAHQRQLSQQARHAGAHGLLVKPLDFGRLQSALTAIADGREEWADANFSNAPMPDAHTSEPATLSQEDLRYALNEELRNLLLTTQADACVLFHLHPATRQVTAFAHQGAPLIGYDKAKYMLQASPVFDVIQSGESIHEPNVAHHRQKFQHLDILSYAACVGLPVRGFGACEHALFLFHAQSEHFTNEHMQQSAVAARFIGSLFTRKEAERAIQQMQPSAFAGQLGSHLVHEINNQLSSVLINAEMLASDVGLDDPTAQLGLGTESFFSERILAELTASPHRFKQLQSYVGELQKNAKAMQKITQLYLGLTGPELRAPVSLNNVIQRVVSLLTPVAEGYGVKIITELEPNLPETHAVAVRLEQAFINIALNAIQHLHLTKGSGDLLLRSHFAGQQVELPLQLRFTDNGHGIHTQLQERIFDLGFTTRHDGGGFGLFITRGLIESMGGSVSIEESVMMVGSTFLIELPLIVPFLDGGAND